MIHNPYPEGCPECGAAVVRSFLTYPEVSCTNGHPLLRVYDLESDPARFPVEEVGCYFCMEAQDHTSYRFGEAFLCGADHAPLDANANYVFTAHLECRAVVCRDGKWFHPTEDGELARWALAHGYSAERLPDWEPDAAPRWQWVGPWGDARFNAKVEGIRGREYPVIDDVVRGHLVEARRRAA